MSYVGYTTLFTGAEAGAEREMSAIAESAADHPYHLFFLSEAAGYLERNRGKQKDYLLQAGAHEAHDPFIVKSVGVYFLINGSERKAIKLFDRAIDLDPSDHESFRHKGLAYSNLGREKKAMEWFTKAVAINPRSSLAQAYYGLGIAWFDANGDGWLDIYLVKLAPRFTVDAALRELAGYSQLKWAQADHILDLRLTPNDPQFGSQWDMQQASDADIDAPEAWDITTGGNDQGGDQLVVAIVDGGCQITHTDLAANLWVNPGEIAGNGIDDDGNGYIDDVHGWNLLRDDADPRDDNGHGTHCAGTIGAVTDNGTGIAGLNWHCQIVGIKILDRLGRAATRPSASPTISSTRAAAGAMSRTRTVIDARRVTRRSATC